MQQHQHSEAGSAFEAALRLDPKHAGAMVNGIHCLQQLPPGDQAARRRLEHVAGLGVAAGLWITPLQRPPHMVHRLTSRPWHDTRDFAWCALLERSYPAIRREVRAAAAAPRAPAHARRHTAPLPAPPRLHHPRRRRAS